MGVEEGSRGHLGYQSGELRLEADIFSGESQEVARTVLTYPT